MLEKPQKVISESAGCLQSGEHINGMLTGKCGRKMYTSKRDDCSLKKFVESRRFKNLRELHREWSGSKSHHAQMLSGNGLQSLCSYSQATPEPETPAEDPYLDLREK